MGLCVLALIPAFIGGTQLWTRAEAQETTPDEPTTTTVGPAPTSTIVVAVDTTTTTIPSTPTTTPPPGVGDSPSQDTSGVSAEPAAPALPPSPPPNQPDAGIPPTAYEWVVNRLKQHDAWEPSDGRYTNGLARGYNEGETAPMLITIEAAAGDLLRLDVCLELGSDPGPYGFTDIETWNRSYTPPFPTDLTGEVDGFNGSGITIDGGAFIGRKGGLCDDTFQTWEVRSRMDEDDGFIVYGAHIAAPGDAIATGGTVPPGQGASQVSGNFQAAVDSSGSGAKTVPFKVEGANPASPAIGIEKATNGVDADTPTGPSIPVGDPVTWTYAVTNTGNVTLTGITVSDDQGVTVTCPQTTLDPGDSMTCTASGTATAGQYANTGTATGFSDPTETQVTDTDPSHYLGTNDGGLPVTGMDADRLSGLGLGLIVLGIVAVVATRRSRRGPS
jgi:hypothetical protein